MKSEESGEVCVEQKNDTDQLAADERVVFYSISDCYTVESFGDVYVM